MSERTVPPAIHHVGNFQIDGQVERIIAALAALQAEWSMPRKTAVSQAGSRLYRYTPLDELLTGCVRALNRKGVALLQSASVEDGRCVVATMLADKLGKLVVMTEVPLDDSTIKGAGSAITYSRRYAITALLGLASVEDDDGGEGGTNGANGNGPGNGEAAKFLRRLSEAKGVDAEKTVKREAMAAGYLWDGAAGKFYRP